MKKSINLSIFYFLFILLHWSFFAWFRPFLLHIGYLCAYFCSLLHIKFMLSHHFLKFHPILISILFTETYKSSLHARFQLAKLVLCVEYYDCLIKFLFDIHIAFRFFPRESCHQWLLAPKRHINNTDLYFDNLFFNKEIQFISYFSQSFIHDRIIDTWINRFLLFPDIIINPGRQKKLFW